MGVVLKVNISGPTTSGSHRVAKLSSPSARHHGPHFFVFRHRVTLTCNSTISALEAKLYLKSLVDPTSVRNLCITFFFPPGKSAPTASRELICCGVATDNWEDSATRKVSTKTCTNSLSWFPFQPSLNHSYDPHANGNK